MRNQATLIVAILALVASVCAIYFDSAHFDRAMKANEQHAEHTELSFSFEMLHIQLNDQLEWLRGSPDDAGAAGRPFHDEATDNWREAGKELLAGNFDRVRELIEVAHDNIEKCYSAAEEEAGRLPLPPRPVWIEPGEVK